MILFPHNLFIFFLVLVSPRRMVSPGAVRPLRLYLSTPLI